MKLLHRHRWVTVAVQHGVTYLFDAQVTVLLQRCECGKATTKTLNGTWDAKDLLP